jgi:hypothetical protein
MPIYNVCHVCGGAGGWIQISALILQHFLSVRVSQNPCWNRETDHQFPFCIFILSELRIKFINNSQWRAFQILLDCIFYHVKLITFRTLRMVFFNNHGCSSVAKIFFSCVLMGNRPERTAENVREKYSG